MGVVTSEKYNYIHNTKSDVSAFLSSVILRGQRKRHQCGVRLIDVWRQLVCAILCPIVASSIHILTNVGSVGGMKLTPFATTATQQRTQILFWQHFDNVIFCVSWSPGGSESCLFHLWFPFCLSALMSLPRTLPAAKAKPYSKHCSEKLASQTHHLVYECVNPAFSNPRAALHHK